MTTEPKDATETTREANERVRASGWLDWDDDRDRQAATRGFLAALDPPVITTGDGRSVWDLEPYAFLEVEEAPPTVNPSLWRHARLNMHHGLFEIADGLYQVRGYDLSVMSVLRGERGWIVVDPLVSAETARASLALVNRHLGEREVVAVVYTHSHADHFGGVEGVTSVEDVLAGRTRIIAPVGFLRSAISENVLAGAVMGRRASYMYGALLPRGPRGQVDAGLGKSLSLGSSSILAPTDEIVETGQVLTVDGVEIEFQLTPGTEAPAEMNFHLPELRALCMAENCSRNLHNLYTPRGAEVRDAKAWARYLDESIVRYLDRTDLVFTSHHWPVWGREACLEYLEKQRDMYQYLHDQTLRLANKGYTMLEIAEMLELPAALAKEWYSRSYYGTVNHDVKAVYQKYLGFFDGNPANLHPHPPVEASRRYVEYMGGAAAVLERARADFERGDYRWVAEVVNRVVFAEPDNVEARLLQADALEQLGYQAESAAWRNFYLMGAKELRDGIAEAPGRGFSLGMVRVMPLELLLDALTVRLDGERAAGISLGIELVVDERGAEPVTYALWVANAVLHHRRGVPLDRPDLIIKASRLDLAALLFGLLPLDDAVAAGRAETDGDTRVLAELLGLFDSFDPHFPIVTP
ncbi:alkyl/aryl-sulfatase [Rhabdothermincola sediminis]|uniref:alkyl/aryl-sulfatase n=1 Tax=Rhabdothermincola sediminis TaxID=2751370 RepID=UPI001AA0709A|nr:alkyl sulfatase dimerization domain-containing protein [Rhabdothermincola sediminis]